MANVEFTFTDDMNQRDAVQYLRWKKAFTYVAMLGIADGTIIEAPFMAGHTHIIDPNLFDDCFYDDPDILKQRYARLDTGKTKMGVVAADHPALKELYFDDER